MLGPRVVAARSNPGLQLANAFGVIKTEGCRFMNKPLCFVLMPFGSKPDAAGTIIDFDAVYKELIKPSIEEAGLEKAMDAYLHGFEADWRDAYPGINTVTLMEIKEPPHPRRERLIPVVTYTVERRIASGKADYWDFATLVELMVLAKDQQRAFDALGKALAAVREIWEPETTARNLRLIREAREHRNEAEAWCTEIEDALEERAEG